MRLLLSGTENYSQSLGTSLHSLFLSHLSEHSALAALPRADQSAANGSPVLCHSSAGSLKSIRRFMVDLERGKKTHLQARSYFLRLPFCSLCAEDKGGSGWRWGTGSGGDEIPRNKSSRSYAQWERIWRRRRNLEEGSTETVPSVAEQRCQSGRSPSSPR